MEKVRDLRGERVIARVDKIEILDIFGKYSWNTAEAVLDRFKDRLLGERDLKVIKRRCLQPGDAQGGGYYGVLLFMATHYVDEEGALYFPALVWNGVRWNRVMFPFASVFARDASRCAGLPAAR